jgi:hypothetical protein
MRLLSLILTGLLLCGCAGQSNNTEVVFISPPAADTDQEFSIRIEFVLFTSEIEQYPVVAQAVEEAISAWTVDLPIEAAVFVENKDFTQLFPLLSPLSRKNVIIVEMVENDLDPSRVGAWFEGSNTLTLNVAKISDDLDLARAVAMHEIGHALGVPHVINSFQVDGAATGDIVVPAGAEKMLMFPFLNEHNIDAKPSELELYHAKLALLNLISTTKR